jgi:1,4-alpha-glucan branching enzyme
MTRLTDDGQVEFRFYRPEAHDVQVEGDFTDWDRKPLGMRHDGDGWWTTVARVSSGDHRFHYTADGHPFADYAANGVERTKTGWDSILSVPAEARTTEVKCDAKITAKSDAKTMEKSKTTKQNKEKWVA